MLRLVALLVISAGCTSIGPGTVARDRFDYSTAIADSWKRQILLNIVKFRYVDPPIFVDVGQIVSGYTLEYGASAGGTLTSGSDSVTLGGSARYTDRPTITYVPLTGHQFQRALMTPLPPASIFGAIQAGWPAEGVLFASVEAINGLRNERVGPGGVSPADEGFLRVLEILGRLQRTGTVALRVKAGDGDDAAILTFRTDDLPPETAAESAELRRLLRLDPEAKELRLSYGQLPADARELAVLSRSVMQMMQVLAAHAEVPEADVAEGRAVPGWESAGAGVESRQRFRLRCTKERPKDAFVSVPYRDSWFWIDDKDLASKRHFAFVMYLFTLADTGERGGEPVLTIPT
ncbi:MAG: hypothetical protein L6Q95_05120 [Planctomycetes bacterium]|nr:hypothetical protein [Planctomycetota bacterium]